jgi:hypothetical protein
LAQFYLVLGVAVGLTAPLAFGETYVRFQPPVDVQRYLGDESPLSGIYRADPILGADYVSFEAFQTANANRLRELGPLQEPSWAWFGNSVVQNPGMLGDTAAAALPDHRMFYLRRSEPLHLRIAQVRLLLLHGFRPERIVVVIVPIDIFAYRAAPPSWIIVNPQGAITYRIRMPAPPFDKLVALSRLALIAWVRSGRQDYIRTHRIWEPMDSIPPALAKEIGAMLGVLGEAARQFSVPISILSIPSRELVFGEASSEPQNQLERLSRDAGLDIFDARGIFADVTDRGALFVPDGHLSALGNQLVLAALLAHFREIGAPRPMGQAEGGL